MLKYDPSVMLLKPDDQKYIKPSEAWHINLPQLAQNCIVIINDQDLFLGDEEAFFEHNIEVIGQEIIQNEHLMETLNKLQPQQYNDLLRFIYRELDKMLKFDYIGWVTPLLFTQGYDRAEAIAELTIQRDKERTHRNWKSPRD